MQRLSVDFTHALTFKLERNYRSTGHILAAANAVISRNMHRIGKTLYTAEGSGERVKIVRCENQEAEAVTVAEAILKLQGDRRLDDIAILFRTNAQAKALEKALIQRKIPCVVVKGTSFYEREEVRHCLAYLSLVADRNDDLAFRRVLNVPTRGLSDKTLTVIEEHAAKIGSSLATAAKQLLEGSVDAPPLSAKAAKSLSAFLDMLAGLEQETRAMSTREGVDTVIKRSGLLELYADKAAKDPLEEGRLDNIRDLVSLAASSGTSSLQVDFPTLSPIVCFLHELSLKGSSGDDALLEPTDRSLSSQEGDGRFVEAARPVQLMTIHAAKGLEFMAVFICGAVDGLIPLRMSDAGTAAQEAADLEEERRLFYVAITRARRHLCITYHTDWTFDFRSKRMLSSQPSPFLADIPAAACVRSDSPYTEFTSGMRRKSGGQQQAGNKQRLASTDYRYNNRR